MYTVASSEKTTAWTTRDEHAHQHEGQGEQRRRRCAKNASTTAWSAAMLPSRRIASDTGRAMWLMSSIGSISGASHQTGPRKCLKYLSAVLAHAEDVGQHED